MWLTFLTLSVSCLILAAVFSFAINSRRVVNKKKFNLFNSLFAGVFVAAFFLFMPTLHMAVTSGSWCGGQRQRCGDSGSGLI